MRIFDKKFKNNKLRYLAQVSLGSLSIAIALSLFDIVNRPVIIASLGASAFVAFAMPKQRISRPRYLIGGYIIGVIVGAIVHCLTFLPIEHDLTQKALYVFSGSMAVGIAMFLMAITNTEHAPATGIALGLVINNWTIYTIIAVLAGITILSTIQRILRPKLMDLI